MRSCALEIMRRLNPMANQETSVPDGQLDIYGINKLRFLDIPYKRLVDMAREIGIPQHELALELWNSDQYEAKILSCILSDPAQLTEQQADEWSQSLESWIICEFCCGRMLWQMPFALKKAVEWADGKLTTVRCAGFTLIASIAANLPPGAANELGFFDYSLFLARKHAADESIEVRRAVSPALQQIGKRGRDWYEAAVEAAEEIAAQPIDAAKWVASQTLGELLSSRVARTFAL